MNAGTQLAGRYVIRSPLGAGGMGEVYRAGDSVLGREVAVKILPEQLSQNPTALSRFAREAKALASLSHPNILAIYDFGSDQGIHFAVMELLHGQDLRRVLSSGALPWEKALEIGTAIVDGLAAAHSKGVIHRDLKPENIFLTAEGVVKILDFGLAQQERTELPQDRHSAKTVTIETQPHTVIGTIGYMAPEQLRAFPLDARTDIFSFGCVFYEMLTGIRAFSGETAADMMAAILSLEPPPLSQSGRNVPPELEPIVRSCLEKNREKRFQSAHDLSLALKVISSTAAFTRTSVRVPAVRKFRLELIPGIAVGVVLAMLAFVYFMIRSGPQEKPITSLAVLPLITTGMNPNNEYLSDGITESIINNISQLPQLRVMARSTVFRYKGKDADPQKIGRDLDVEAVLAGSLIQRDETLIMNVELISVADGSQIWGKQYTKRISDMVLLQSEISGDISEKLRLKLTGQQQERLAKSYTEDYEAYQLYLKGRYFWNKRTEEGFNKGITYFQQAIERDPGYALAYSGLADSYTLLGTYDLLPTNEAFTKAQAAARKALEIDPFVGEAHASLGLIHFRHDLELSAAGKEFRRAIELNPNYVSAHHWFALYLSAKGQHREAIVEIRTAQSLDPFSTILNKDFGLVLYFAGKYDEAIRQCRETLEMDPNLVSTHFILSLVYEQKGMHAQAVDEDQKFLILSGDKETAQTMLETYRTSGFQGYYRKYLELAYKQVDLGESPSAFVMAEICVRAEKDCALEWLEKAYQNKDPRLVYLKVDPAFRSIRSDPRFADLVRRAGL